MRIISVWEESKTICSEIILSKGEIDKDSIKIIKDYAHDSGNQISYDVLTFKYNNCNILVLPRIPGIGIFELNKDKQKKEIQEFYNYLMGDMQWNDTIMECTRGLTFYDIAVVLRFNYVELNIQDVQRESDRLIYRSN